MKKLLLTLLILGLCFTAQAAPPTRVYTYTSGNTLDPDQNTANEDAIFSYFASGVDNLASNSVTSSNIVDATIVAADLASNSVNAAKVEDGTMGDAEVGDTLTLKTINASNTVTFNESGNNNVLSVDNDGTGAGIIIYQESTGTAMDITHNGTGSGLNFSQAGALSPGSHCAIINGSGTTTNADSAVVRILQSSASATEPTLEISNAGNAAVLHVENTGTAATGLVFNGVDITTDNDVACIMTATRGPTGAQTDIQGFLIVVIDGDTAYIPYW